MLRKYQTAPAKFIGVQPGFAGVPPLLLFNMEQDVHTATKVFVHGSTVTKRSLEDAGLVVPDAELAKASNALLNYMAQRRQVLEAA